MNSDRKFMQMAYEYAEQNSRCMRRKVGAVLISQDENSIVFSANAPFPNPEQCFADGCARNKEKIISGQNINVCRCIHAELDLIIQCASRGISPQKSTVYCVLSPCANCARVLIKSGISRLVFCEEYPNTEYQSIFKDSKIIVEKYV